MGKENDKRPQTHYRVSVEMVVLCQGRILLMKRSDEAETSTGMWYVPAGKVRYEEIPTEAAIRECREETGLESVIVREMGCRAFKLQEGGEDIYRLMFTYLMRPIDEDAMDKVQMNREHSTFMWVDRQVFCEEDFDVPPALKKMILTQIFS